MMKKKTLAFLLSLVVCITTYAIPAKPGQWRIITLSDGSTVRAELKGDEFLHYWQDEKGITYQETESGRYVAVDMTRKMAIASEQKKQANAVCRARRIILGEEHTPYIGTKKGILILVNFSDVKLESSHNNELYTRLMNEHGFNQDGLFKGSVRDYFMDQSDGQFELDFDVYGPYTLPANRAYYGGNITDTDGTRLGDSHAATMAAKACELAYKDGANFSPYDWDGDGIVEQVYIIYAGLGEANGGDDDTIWPHKGQLSRSEFGKKLKVGSVYVNTYACGPELQPTRAGGAQIDGIGTICHEFSHCLGIPDFYDVNYGGQYGMDDWDLMCSGSYNGNSYTPAGYTAYERMYAGWKQPIELNQDMTVEGMKGLQEGGETYIIYNDGNPNEYFLFENRKKVGWDAALPGEGLLITHVDFDATVWATNSVNTLNNYNNHQRCTPVQADNGASGTGSSSDVFPYRDHNSFSDSSTPVAQWYNTNKKGNRRLNKIVKNITKANNKSISFVFINSKDEDVVDLTDIDYTNAIFAETFNKMKSTGGNDGLWSGDIAYGMFRSADNSGWEYASANAAKACAKFTDYAITPAFTLENDAVAYFSVAPWGDDETTLELSAIGEGDASNLALDQTSFELKNGRWNVFKTMLSGRGSVKLKFSVGAGVQFFIDGVSVRDALIDGIEDATLTTKTLSVKGIFDLQGRRMTTDFHSLPHGMYIMNGHKVYK